MRAVVRNPIACVLLHLSLVKFQQEWSQGVHSGAVLRIRKKMPQTRCQKLPQRLLRQKRGSPNSRLASVYYIYPKQCIAIETVPYDHPVIFHEFCLCTAVGMSAKWGIPVPNLSLLVMLCLVFVGECICKVISFKWLSKNVNADASNLIGKAKFIVAVVGPVTLLSTDAASTVASFREH